MKTFMDEVTFNACSVDGDTSTNDTAALLASGASGASIDSPRAVKSFTAALDEVCQSLANSLQIGALATIPVAEAIIEDKKAKNTIQENAAWALGIDHETGSLEPGKKADVVLWSGNPFSIYSKADQVFIDGALVFDRANPALQPATDFELGLPAEEVPW